MLNSISVNVSFVAGIIWMYFLVPENFIDLKYAGKLLFNSLKQNFNRFIKIISSIFNIPRRLKIGSVCDI